MKLSNIVLTLTLVFKFLQHERTNSYEDYLTRKRTTQKPPQQPIEPDPSICTCNSIKPLRPNPNEFYSSPPITKYQIEEYYKNNPYKIFR